MFDFFSQIPITQIINYIATLVMILCFLYFVKFYFIYNPFRENSDVEQFEGKLSNFLYKISFKPPFNFLVGYESTEKEKVTDKVEKLKKLIKESESSKVHNVRTLMTLQYMLIFIAVSIFGLSVLLFVNLEFFLTYVLNIQDIGTYTDLSYSEAITQSLLPTFFFLITPIIPTLKMKKKANKLKMEKDKDLPILQMFIILFLKSSKTIEDMLFSMSKLNTAYKVSFEKAYRISVRSKKDALEFLINSFENEKFKESLEVIKELQDYAREDCLKIMESNLNIITDDLENNKRKSDLSSLVYSQAIIAIPFIALLLLVGSPLVQVTFNLMDSMGGGF